MIFLIADIESKLKRIEEDPEGSGTLHLFNCIQGVTSIANRAFEQLFERQVGRLSILKLHFVEDFQSFELDSLSAFLACLISVIKNVSNFL